MSPTGSNHFVNADVADMAVRDAVLEITRSAFLINPETGMRIEGDTPTELPMVQALFARGVVDTLHTAMRDGAVAGYILYTEGTLSENPGLRVLGLTIMGTAPALQRHGIGTELLKWSVEQLRGTCDAAFVVGHPGFYPKAGFVPSVEHGVTFTFPAPPEVCMILPLSHKALRPGVASYHPVVHEFF